MYVTKDTLLRKHINSKGYQINKSALKELNKYFLAHMNVIMSFIEKKDIKRITPVDIANVLEKIWKSQQE